MRTMRRLIPVLMIAVTAAVRVGSPAAPASAAGPEGTITWALHVTLAARWLDPLETEAQLTPYMVLYALHDALVKPMPGNFSTPSLAESWTVSRSCTSRCSMCRSTSWPSSGAWDRAWTNPAPTSSRATLTRRPTRT